MLVFRNHKTLNPSQIPEKQILFLKLLLFIKSLRSELQNIISQQYNDDGVRCTQFYCQSGSKSFTELLDKLYKL